MHTIETAIVMPAILFFVLITICVCLKYTEAISRRADALREAAGEHTVSNADIARGGAVLYDLYQKYAG